MSNLVGNIICHVIQSIAVLLFFKILFKKENTKISINLKDLLSVVLLTIIIFCFYGTEYSAFNPIISFLSIVLGLIFIYNFNFSKAFLCSGLFMVFLFFSDLVVSVFFVNFLKIEDVRSIPIHMILSNFLVGIINLSIIRINKIKNKIIEIIETNENKENIQTFSFLFLLISALSITVYTISNNYSLNKVYASSVIGIIIFIILAIIFFREKYERVKLINKYDQLFEYVQTFENWLDNESMNNHESKNQLATLREMVKHNKKAIEYIDNIIKETINTESKNTIKLKNIPKGGLKGLLYYKITIAENNKITLFVDVSNKVEPKLLKLTADENKMLCRLVGIFFDNAIEAAKDSDKKIISCEIYTSGENITIAISNTFFGSLELNRLSQNGYSTKGKGRGKGLYLAKKFSKSYDTFTLENRIINEYYVQKIIIKGT